MDNSKLQDIMNKINDDITFLKDRIHIYETKYQKKKLYKENTSSGVDKKRLRVKKTEDKTINPKFHIDQVFEELGKKKNEPPIESDVTKIEDDKKISEDKNIKKDMLKSENQPVMTGKKSISISKEEKKAAAKAKKEKKAAKKKNRSPEEQKKINDRMAAIRAKRKKK